MKEGQIATVTIEALRRARWRRHRRERQPGAHQQQRRRWLRRHLPARSAAEGLEVGMSATAEVVVEQAEGLDVPTTAVKAASVTVVRTGEHAVVQPVTTGLAGDSSTMILSAFRRVRRSCCRRLPRPARPRRSARAAAPPRVRTAASAAAPSPAATSRRTTRRLMSWRRPPQRYRPRARAARRGALVDRRATAHESADEGRPRSWSSTSARP